jgi:hypothetical protein
MGKPEIQTQSARLKMRRTLLAPLSVLALLSGCVAPAPSATTALQSDTLSSKTPAMVTPNPDGTLTVKKGASSGDHKSSGVEKGLVIPAQVITPTVRTAEKQQDGTSPF